MLPEPIAALGHNHRLHVGAAPTRRAQGPLCCWGFQCRSGVANLKGVANYTGRRSCAARTRLQPMALQHGSHCSRGQPRRASPATMPACLQERPPPSRRNGLPSRRGYAPRGAVVLLEDEVLARCTSRCEGQLLVTGASRTGKTTALRRAPGGGRPPSGRPALASTRSAVPRRVVAARSSTRRVAIRVCVHCPAASAARSSRSQSNAGPGSVLLVCTW
jgi:hypothetical protein